MTMWHSVGALTGQLFDAPAGNLSFAPRLPPPYTLPVLLPGKILTLSQQRAHGPFTLRFEGGTPLMRLAVLSANGLTTASPRELSRIGDAVTWGGDGVEG